MSAAEIAFHDAECGGYDADLPLWAELADQRPGPVVDLGCGTGRVALHLAGRGHGVIAIDRDPILVGELKRRAAEAGAAVRALVADAAGFDPGEPAGLVLAPMQLVQLLDAGRCGLLIAAAAACLRPGGLLAIAVVEGEELDGYDHAAEPAPGAGPIPDVREHRGWVYSSLPLALRRDGSTASVLRLRQAVSPGGELSERREETILHLHDPAALERTAAAAGLSPLPRRVIDPTHAHHGSVVVVAERVAA